MQDPQIFLSSSGALVRFLGEDRVLLVKNEAEIGDAVPPEGPLMRRLSAITFVSASKIQNPKSGIQISATRGFLRYTN